MLWGQGGFSCWALDSRAEKMGGREREEGGGRGQICETGDTWVGEWMSEGMKEKGEGNEM